MGGSEHLRVIASERVPGASYHLQTQLGSGAMATAHFAYRRDGDSVTPVVVKLTRAEVVAMEGDTVATMFRKEAVALGRLNEQVPPTPFVVRLIDAGSVEQRVLGRAVTVPWLAVEHVYGGREGTTLYDRVEHSVDSTGFAFDRERAALALRCIGSGLRAIHAVGVVHRDLAPANVLCCGFGDAEMFKIADFGIARAQGVDATFRDVAFGTPGYSAPEQSFDDGVGVAEWSDVFSFACVAFYLLTGEDYFRVRTATECLVAARDVHQRRSIRDSSKLVQELRDDPVTCAAIDELITHATAARGTDRPQSAERFAQSLCTWLSKAPKSSRAHPLRVKQLELRDRDTADHAGLWKWSVRARPATGAMVLSAAWDASGTCFAATTAGARVFSGTGWQPLDPSLLGDLGEPMLVQRNGPGQWLLGDADGYLMLYDSIGVSRTVELPPSRRPGGRWVSASGTLDDLLILVEEKPTEVPRLHARIGDYWVKPFDLEQFSVVLSAARFGWTQWVLGGRGTDGKGLAVVYDATEFQELSSIRLDTRAILSCATHAELGIALGVGSEGQTVEISDGGSAPTRTTVPGDLSVAAIDPGGRLWAGGRGRLLTRDSRPGSEWTEVWSNEGWTAPFVRLLADDGRVQALTVDGGVLEGARAESEHVPRRA